MEATSWERTVWQRADSSCRDAPREWATREPGEAGFEAHALRRLARDLDTGALGPIHAVLVVRDGALVFERYVPGDDWLWGQSLGRVEFGPETLHDQRSVTKSVVGALVGIAHGQGALSDLDARVVDLLPDRPGDKDRLAALTLRHALTMTAGLAWDEQTHPYWDPRNDEHAMSIAEDPIGYALSRPLVDPPGRRFRYNGGLPSVLAAILEHATGRSLDRYAVDELFCPLGVGAFEWVRHPSGLHLAASGLRLRPRDMARFGQLLLDDGRLGPRPILPAGYVRAMLSAQVETGPQSPLGGHYGYQWWMTSLDTGRGPAELPAASGNGGQRIVIDRASRTIVVITAGAYDSPGQGEGPTRIVEAVFAAMRGHRGGPGGESVAGPRPGE